jgi:1,4-alpha-glucan branching enzyme
LVEAFGRFQAAGLLEIITCAATHALLPLLNHPPSVRAQILTARAFHRRCFGQDPRGIWLPECAYSGGGNCVAGGVTSVGSCWIRTAC